MEKICKNCGKEFRVKPSHAARRFSCSRKCAAERYKITMRGKNNPHWKGGMVEKKCVVCGKIFLATPSLKNYRKNCSKKCLGIFISFLFYKKKKNKKPKLAIKLFRYQIANCYQIKKCACGNKVVKSRIHCAKCLALFMRSKMLNVKCCICGKCLKRYKSTIKNRVFCDNCNRNRKIGALNPNWRGGRRTANAIIRASDKYKEWRASVFERDNFTCQKCFQHGGSLHAHHIKEFSSHPDLIFSIKNGETLCLKCHGEIHNRNFKKWRYSKKIKGATEAIKFVEQYLPYERK